MNWQVIDRWKAWNCIKNYIILSFIVKIIDTTIIFNLFEVTSNSFLSLFSSDLICSSSETGFRIVSYDV